MCAWVGPVGMRPRWRSWPSGAARVGRRAGRLRWVPTDQGRQEPIWTSGDAPRWRSWRPGAARRGAAGGMVEMGGPGSGSGVRGPGLSGRGHGGAHGPRAMAGVGRRAGWWRWAALDQGAMCARRTCREAPAVALMAFGRCPAWGAGRDGGDGRLWIRERCAHAGPVGKRPRWRSWPSGAARRGAPGGMVEMGAAGSGSGVRGPGLSGRRPWGERRPGFGRGGGTRGADQGARSSARLEPWARLAA